MCNPRGFAPNMQESLLRTPSRPCPQSTCHGPFWLVAVRQEESWESCFSKVSNQTAEGALSTVVDLMDPKIARSQKPTEGECFTSSQIQSICVIFGAVYHLILSLVGQKH